MDGTEYKSTNVSTLDAVGHQFRMINRVIGVSILKITLNVSIRVDPVYIVVKRVPVIEGRTRVCAVMKVPQEVTKFVAKNAHRLRASKKSQNGPKKIPSVSCKEVPASLTPCLAPKEVSLIATNIGVGDRLTDSAVPQQTNLRRH